MLDPDGDGDNEDYYEIQIGPQNLVFDSQFDKYNEPKTELADRPLRRDEDWSSKLKSAVGPRRHARQAGRHRARATRSKPRSPGRASAKARRCRLPVERRVAPESLRHEGQRRRRAGRPSSARATATRPRASARCGSSPRAGPRPRPWTVEHPTAPRPRPAPPPRRARRPARGNPCRRRWRA